MDGIERLQAIEDIKQLKARYFRCMDTKDWDGFAAVFTPDATMDVSGEMRDGVSVSRTKSRSSPRIQIFRGTLKPCLRRCRMSCGRWRSIAVLTSDFNLPAHGAALSPPPGCDPQLPISQTAR